jgi:hypothetical protein
MAAIAVFSWMKYVPETWKGRGGTRPYAHRVSQYLTNIRNALKMWQLSKQGRGIFFLGAEHD